MEKIPTLYLRDPETNRVWADHNPECTWVFRGEGIATRMWDGTACMARKGQFYMRAVLNPLSHVPRGFEPSGAQDFATRMQPGWILVGGSAQDRPHWEAWELYCELAGGPPADGTYELCGPKVRGNPEGFARHVLVKHFPVVSREIIPGLALTLTFEGLKQFFQTFNIEGIVWYHAEDGLGNGRKAKIKARNFGLERSGAPSPAVLLPRRVIVGA